MLLPDNSFQGNSSSGSDQGLLTLWPVPESCQEIATESICVKIK